VKFIFDNTTNIFLLILALSSGAALLFLSLQSRGAKASPLEATQMMNQGKSLILDVRSSDQFAQGHLRDAKNIALADLSTRLNELNKFKAQAVIVVCGNGNLSARATTILQAAGFERAVRLDGGLAAWQAAGLPIAKTDVKS
jgi:rhodanese-related sulfurtransferase